MVVEACHPPHLTDVVMGDRHPSPPLIPPAFLYLVEPARPNKVQAPGCDRRWFDGSPGSNRDIDRRIAIDHPDQSWRSIAASHHPGLGYDARPAHQLVHPVQQVVDPRSELTSSVLIPVWSPRSPEPQNASRHCGNSSKVRQFCQIFAQKNRSTSTTAICDRQGLGFDGCNPIAVTCGVVGKLMSPCYSVHCTLIHCINGLSLIARRSQAVTPLKRLAIVWRMESNCLH